MRKFIGGCVLLLIALFLLRGGTTTQFVDQVGQLLDSMVNLGAHLADRTQAGRP